MFGRKAPTPCNNWLGLNNYKPDSFKSKTAWLNEQFNAMLYTNKQALKGIINLPSVIRTIPAARILPFLLGITCCCVIIPRDAIRFRISTSLMFMLWLVIIRNSNVYYVQLLNSSKPGQPKVVNRRQLYDLKRSSPPSTSSSGDADFAKVPSFFNRWSSQHQSNISNSNDQYYSHHYSTHSKCKTAATDGTVVETIVTHF